MDAGRAPASSFLPLASSMNISTDGHTTETTRRLVSFTASFAAPSPRWSQQITLHTGRPMVSLIALSTILSTILPTVSPYMAPTAASSERKREISMRRIVLSVTMYLYTYTHSFHVCTTTTGDVDTRVSTVHVRPLGVHKGGIISI